MQCLVAPLLDLHAALNAFPEAVIDAMALVLELIVLFDLQELRHHDSFHSVFEAQTFK
jgi:hypothetical protein